MAVWCLAPPSHALAQKLLRHGARGAGAVFSFADDSTFSNRFGTIAFVNDGLAQKTGGTGTSFFGLFTNNATGTVQATSGTLTFAPGETLKAVVVPVFPFYQHLP